VTPAKRSQPTSRPPGSHDPLGGRRTERTEGERRNATASTVRGIRSRRLRKGAETDDPAVRDLAEEHRQQIDRWFYPCDHRMHAALADLYEADPRFTASLDQPDEGVAAFLAEAIRANARR